MLSCLAPRARSAYIVRPCTQATTSEQGSVCGAKRREIEQERNVSPKTPLPQLRDHARSTTFHHQSSGCCRSVKPDATQMEHTMRLQHMSGNSTDLSNVALREAPNRNHRSRKNGVMQDAASSSNNHRHHTLFTFRLHLQCPTSL